LGENLSEFDWKQQSAYKRRSQVSTVIIIETEDPKRTDELLEFAISKEIVSTDYFNIDLKGLRRIIADPWEGLIEWNSQRQGWIAMEAEGSSPFPTMGMDLGTAMRSLDKILKQQPTVAIIKNITSQELARAISIALQNWSTHPKIVNQTKSTVFVVTPDSLLFDDQTRRLCILIEPPFSTEEERKAMLDEVAKAFKQKYEKLILTASSGMTLHDLETAALESIFKNGKVQLSAITTAKMDLMRKYGFDLTYPRHGWESVGGCETMKDYITNNVICIIKDDVARRWGVGASRGILFFGIGGTGKSLIAKCMAKELGLPFIKVSSADIFAGIVGETERKVRNLQKVAEANAPCIVFIDEIDQIGLKRDMVISTDSGVGRRAMNMLMDWLGDDERKSIIVGATNLISQLDTAFIRAGRFDDKIPLFPPAYEGRIDILKVHTSVVRKIPIDAKLVNLAKIAEKTAMWSGAELELLCVASARIARSLNKVMLTSGDFVDAMKEVAVNLEKREREIKDFVATAKEYASNHRLLEQQLKEYLTKEKGEATDRIEALKKELNLQ